MNGSSKTSTIDRKKSGMFWRVLMTWDVMFGTSRIAVCMVNIALRMLMYFTASVPSMISTDSGETDRISFPVPQVPQSFPTGFPPTFQPYPVQHQGVIPGVVPGLVPTFPVPGGPGPIVPAPPATVPQHPLATPVVPGPVRYRPSEQTPVIPRPPTVFVPSRPSTGSPRPGTEPIPIPPRGEDGMGGITVVSRSSDGSSTWTDSRRSSPSYRRDYDRHGTITSARPSSSGQSRPSRPRRDSSTHRASSRRSPSHRESSTHRPSSHRASSLQRSDSPSPLVVANPSYSPSIPRPSSTYSRPYSRPGSAYNGPTSVHSRPASAQEFHPPTVHVIAPSTTGTPGQDLSAPPLSAVPVQSQQQPTIIIQQPPAPAAAPIIIQNPAQQPSQVITMPPSGGAPSMAGSIGGQDIPYDSHSTTMYAPTMPPIPSTPTHMGHPQQLQPPTVIHIPGQPGYPLSDAHGMPAANYPVPQSGYGIPGQPTYVSGPGGQHPVTSVFPSAPPTTFVLEDRSSGSTRSSSSRTRSRSRSRHRRRSDSRRSHSGSRRYSRERYPSATAPTPAPPVIIHTSNPIPAGPSRRSSSRSRSRSPRRHADPSQHPIVIQQPPGSQIPMTPMPGQLGSVPGMPYTVAPTFPQPGTFMTQGPPLTAGPPPTQIIMRTDTRSSRSRSRSPSRREHRRSHRSHSRSRSRDRTHAPVIIQTPGPTAPLTAPPTVYPPPPTTAGIPMMMMPPSAAPQPAVIVPSRSRSSSRGRHRSPSHGRRQSSPRQTIVLPPTQSIGGPAPVAPSSQPILIHQPAVPGPPLQQIIPGQHLPPGMVMQPSIMRQPTSRRSHSRSRSPHRSERYPQQSVPPPTTIVQVPGAPIPGQSHPTGHLPSVHPSVTYPLPQGRYAMTGHPTTYGRRSPSPRRDHGRRSRSSSPHHHRRPRSYSSSRSPSRRGHRSARSRSYDRHGRRHSRSYSPHRRLRSHSRDRHSRPHSSDYSRRRSPVSTRRHSPPSTRRYSPISTRRYSPVSTRRRSPVSTRRYSPVSTRQSGSPVRGERSPSPRWRSTRTAARQTRSLTPPPTSRRHATRAASPPRIRTVGRSPPRIRVVNEPTYSTRRGASPRRQHSFRSSSETSVQRYPYRGRRQRPVSPSPSFRSITPTQTRHGGTSLGPRRSRSLSPPSPQVLPPRSVRRYADQVRDGDSPVRAGEGAGYPRSAEEDDRSIRITVPSRHPGRRSPSILPLDQRSPVLHPHAPSPRPVSHLSEFCRFFGYPY